MGHAGDQQLGGAGREGGCEDGRLRGARPMQAEGEDEASDEGRQARDLRQGRDGEGEAGTEDCEGLPGEGHQGQHLSRCLDPLRGSWVEFGTVQRRLAWPLCKDDTRKSRSVNNLASEPLPLRQRGTSCLAPRWPPVGVPRGRRVKRHYHAPGACECWPLPAQPLYLLAESQISA